MQAQAARSALQLGHQPVVLPVVFVLPLARVLQEILVGMLPSRQAQGRLLVVLCRSLLAQEMVLVVMSALLQEMAAALVASYSSRVGLPRRVAAAAFPWSRPMEQPRVLCPLAVVTHPLPTRVQCDFHLVMPQQSPALSRWP